MAPHRRAVTVLVAAVLLDLILGLLYSWAERITALKGLYWALTTATTVGYGDITPRSTAGHVIAALAMLTVIPLFAAAFSLVTSGLTTKHVSVVRERVEHIIKHHPQIPDIEE